MARELLKVTLWFTDDEGVDCEEQVELPAVYVVCPRCDGRGVHDPEGFANGFTSSDLAEAGPEFCDDYARGVYDVACAVCGGQRVVLEPDRDRCDPTLLARYDAMRADEAAYRAEVAAERRMGA